MSNATALLLLAALAALIILLRIGRLAHKALKIANEAQRVASGADRKADFVNDRLDRRISSAIPLQRPRRLRVVASQGARDGMD